MLKSALARELRETDSEAVTRLYSSVHGIEKKLTDAGNPKHRRDLMPHEAGFFQVKFGPGSCGKGFLHSEIFGVVMRKSLEEVLYI